MKIFTHGAYVTVFLLRQRRIFNESAHRNLYERCVAAFLISVDATHQSKWAAPFSLRASTWSCGGFMKWSVMMMYWSIMISQRASNCGIAPALVVTRPSGILLTFL